MVVLPELPQGSSSSSSTHGHSSSTCGPSSSTQDHRYDVFLSFRGVDTRLSFTNYLYEALLDANITTFLDDEEIETGEDLKPELESAIKASRASIIVLSKNYASSTWCLDELVLILEQRMTSNHIVIPIFYHVEPTHVRKQQSSFGEAMTKHKQKMDEETDENKRSQWAQKIERWNKALIEVANLKGNDVNGRFETEFIEEIVKDIHQRLHVPLRSAQPLFIGMDYHINFVTSWLKDGSSHTADILTISGIGGIGKTSLAKHVYGLHCHEFHKSSYIEDIGRRCDEKYNGLLDIQKQLCGDISKTSSIQVYDVSKYTSMIENVVARRRVFLVLDDINSKTMFLDGCNLGESRIKIMDMDSLEICTVNNIGINRPFVGSMPRDLKSSAMFFPRSLVTLSLVNNNMSHESFPMDFSCLIMLKELYLDYNPINSMPSCVRTLPRLEILSMQYCNKLKSVEYPPRTLKQLFIEFDYGYIMLEKVVFDPEMSPLQLPMIEWRDPFELELIYSRGMNDQEIEGMIKMQAMMTVEEKVLRSLGWTNLDFLNKKRVGTNSSESEIQMMFYEFGIFSTRYEAEEMPSWFRHRSAGPSISFTIPSSLSSSSPNNLLTGLNFCSLHTLNLLDEELDLPDDDIFPWTPMMTISNITKNRMWIYERHPDRLIKDGKCWVVLSHWMFGMNEMEAGDHVTVTVTEVYGEVIKECGVSLVYDDGEEEDALGYYKSWNHIIGGDLSPFQTTTGQYILNNWRFFQPGVQLFSSHRKFVTDGPNYQEQKEDCWFRALSPRKLDILGPACEGKGESSGSRP